MARRLSRGIVVGALVGLGCGAAARVLMRLVTVTAGGEAQFSWAGSGFVVGLFAVVAIPGALLAAAYAGRGRSALLWAGSALLCVPATSVAAADLSAVTGLSVVDWTLTGAGTVAIYVAILAQPVIVLRLLAPGWGAQASLTRPRRAFVSAR